MQMRCRGWPVIGLLSALSFTCPHHAGGQQGFHFRETAKEKFVELNNLVVEGKAEVEEISPIFEVPATIKPSDEIYKRAGELLKLYEKRIDAHAWKQAIEVPEGNILLHGDGITCGIRQTFVLMEDPADHDKSPILTVFETRLVRDCGLMIKYLCNAAYIRTEYGCYVQE